MDLSTVLMHSSNIAREAGGILMDFFGNSFEQSTKSNDADIVTEADKKAEEAIVKFLTKHYPTHHIVGEEGGGMGAPKEEAEYIWYVDPLDGTVNFASGLPYFAVSIAMTNKDNEPLVGVVYDPTRDELFSAVKGVCSTLNDKWINVTKTAELKQAMVCSGFPYSKWTNPDNNLKEWANITTKVRGVRRLGASALDLVYVACGRLDIYWEPDLNLWDIMAGVLIVQEAGGKVSDYKGDDSTAMYKQRAFLATNSLLHQSMIESLNITD